MNFKLDWVHHTGAMIPRDNAILSRQGCLLLPPITTRIGRKISIGYMSICDGQFKLYHHMIKWIHFSRNATAQNEIKLKLI